MKATRKIKISSGSSRQPSRRISACSSEGRLIVRYEANWIAAPAAVAGDTRFPFGNTVMFEAYCRLKLGRHEAWEPAALKGISVHAVSTTSLFRKDRGSRKFFARGRHDPCRPAGAKSADRRTGRAAWSEIAPAQRAGRYADRGGRSAASRGGGDPASARPAAGHRSFRERSARR